MSRSVRIILDTLNFADDIQLVPLEVDDSIIFFMATTFMAGCNPTLIVSTTSSFLLFYKAL